MYFDGAAGKTQVTLMPTVALWFGQWVSQGGGIRETESECSALWGRDAEIGNGHKTHNNGPSTNSTKRQCDKSFTKEMLRFSLFLPSLLVYHRFYFTTLFAPRLLLLASNPFLSTVCLRPEYPGVNLCRHLYQFGITDFILWQFVLKNIMRLKYFLLAGGHFTALNDGQHLHTLLHETGRYSWAFITWNVTYMNKIPCQNLPRNI